jgi:phenylpyruvate tautomerase PptA (4-oxalocrotonate tautomerase family)
VVCVSLRGKSRLAQIKIYGLRDRLNPIKSQMSDVIHACVMDVLQLPAGKRAHRFFPLDPSDFYYPDGRSEQYTIIEISMFEGRSTAAKKQLIGLLFQKFAAELAISPQDLEITIFETPRHNWGIRGMVGDELSLNYKVEV